MMIRSAVLFVVVGLLAAGLLYERVDAGPQEVVAVEEASVVTPSISDPARLDGAWFCPTGSSSDGGFADHQVRISNLSEDPAVANVGILTGEGKGPNLRVELNPLSSQVLPLSSLAQADVAGAVVEIIGGTGVVGHQVITEHGPAEGPCATHVSSSWFFAGGRTQRDSLEYLALMNPFPEDVVYNVELYRSAGRPRKPGPLQGDVVPASSVKIIELGEHSPREEVVAAAITTVRGRLVVERLQTFNGDLGPTGAALQLGVTGPARSWMLPAGRIHSQGDDQVIVFNPSADEVADIDLELWPVNPTDRSLYGLGAIPRQLLPGRFEVIDLRIEADRFGLRLPFEVGVSVRSSNGVPVVAERWHLASEVDRSLIGAGGTEVAPTDEEATDGEDGADGTAADDGTATDDAANPDDGTGTDDEGTDPDSAANPDGEETEPGELDVPGILGGEVADLAQPTASMGAATSRGTEILSDRWIVPWVATPTDDSSVIIVTSPVDASVEVFILVNGLLQGPSRATIPAGGRAIVPVDGGGEGGPVLVVSDAPVTVEAQIVSPVSGLSIVPGIPTVDQ